MDGMLVDTRESEINNAKARLLDTVTAQQPEGHCGNLGTRFRRSVCQDRGLPSATRNGIA